MVFTAALWIGTALVVIAAGLIFSIFAIRAHTYQAIEICDQIKDEFKNAAIDDIKAMLVLQIEMGKQYHKNVLFRANLSFIVALVFASIGILLFFCIIIFMVFGLSSSITTTVISGVAGALVQVLAAINFSVYNRASDQLQTFHKSLERLQNYMLANSICQGLGAADKGRTCAQLSLIIASASVSENEERVIGEIIKQRALFSAEQHQNGLHAPIQNAEP